MVGTVITADKDHYVAPVEADAVLESCPDVQWRLLFGLARFAGLRVPGGTHGITWADVDWQRGRLCVQRPKTERYEQHRQRIVPIAPKLRAIRQDAFDVAPEGKPESCRFQGTICIETCGRS